MPANTNAISITFLREDNNMKLIQILCSTIILCSSCSLTPNQKQEQQVIEVEVYTF